MAIILLFYQVSNGAIQWNIKCQKGRLLYYFIKCQMGRFNGILSAKWGYYYYMPNGRSKLLCQLGRCPDHGLFAFHASA